MTYKTVGTCVLPEIKSAQRDMLPVITRDAIIDMSLKRIHTHTHTYTLSICQATEPFFKNRGYLILIITKVSHGNITDLPGALPLSAQM